MAHRAQFSVSCQECVYGLHLHCEREDCRCRELNHTDYDELQRHLNVARDLEFAST